MNQDFLNKTWTSLVFPNWLWNSITVQSVYTPPLSHPSVMSNRIVHIRTRISRCAMSSFAAHVLPEVGTCNFFLSPHIAILQLEANTSAIAIPQLFKEMCSATPNPQFWDCYFFWSPQLQSFTSATFGIFLDVESGRFMKKNQRWKILSYCTFKARFCFPEKQAVLSIFLVDFLNHPELRKRD
jgi:hypothetical protein